MPPQLQTIVCRPLRYYASLCKCNGIISRQTSRSFSGSASPQTRLRKSMWSWLETQGKNFLEPLPGSTNYLGAYNSKGHLKRLSGEGSKDELPPESHSDLMPFPQNGAFRSEPVVSEEMREAIWKKIMEEGLSVKAVSAQVGVEMNRVGAIVRLKEIEKEWVRKGKRLAKPYAKAVMAMLPQTPYSSNPKDRSQPHESINDLPVHVATMRQIFYPTSESRHFTRVDAAKVFDETLLPADQRVPHPELAELERDKLAGMSYEERVERAAQRNDELHRKRLAASQRQKEKESKAVKLISGSRWDFKFRDISVDDAGVDGRGHRGTGWRYGVPHMDRRRGEVKIPTRVE